MKIASVLFFSISLASCVNEVKPAKLATQASENTVLQYVYSFSRERFPTINLVDDPAQYYAKRVRARDFVFEEKWKIALPLLEELVAQYPDDGDTWYMLGITRMQTDYWVGAIAALENTIELGTMLRSVPTGSSPSNDIMVLIAQCYAALGDAENTRKWINKSLAARYDDRPSLNEKSYLEGALSAVEYQKLVGDYLKPNMSRDALWRADLAHLSSEMLRLHFNLYGDMSQSKFQKQVNDIDARIPFLSDEGIVFEFMKLVGKLRSGHNLIIPTNGAKGSFSRLPIEFYWFSDGLFVVDANEGFESFIGSQILSIGGIPIRQVLNGVGVLNARDNEMQSLWLSPYYISMPEVLEGLGVIDDVAAVPLRILDANGVEQNITLSGTKWAFHDFPKLPKHKSGNPPKYLKKRDQLFWMEALPDHNAIFVQFNWVNERSDNRLADFSRKLIDLTNESGLDNLIVDIRHNSGGNGAILPSLVRAVIYFEVANPDGKLFVITGRGTYSAAHNFLTDISRLTNAVIVGEPSGSRPNAISEAGWFKLPHSGLLGLVSSQLHQYSEAEDHRIWIAPHIPTPLSSSDYFLGRDPSTEAIFQVIKDRETSQ